jgi:translation elongation factor EF-1beta
VKPWDDETPMDKLKECVKSIVMDGLVWGADKFVPVGYGINKLQVQPITIIPLNENEGYSVWLYKWRRFALGYNYCKWDT